ncbi:MAG: surE [Myxococcaceae bacterium]|nr:surE [Myxococcaceae bacterium]
MRILVANDDGVFSPGLQVLAEVASGFGEVRIVAPDVEQSSVGHAITASRPLSYRPTRIGHFNGWRVNGTPADCIALGIHHWSHVDAVLSGINQGLNLGNAIWHSGTLAAAKQAALFGVRGIAMSAGALETAEEYDLLRPWAAAVLRTLLSKQNESRLNNVNFPANPRGIRWTRQSVRQYDGKVVPGTAPSGRVHFWFTAVPLEGVEAGTDRWAFAENYVSVTPLRLDLTDERALAHAQAGLPFDDAQIPRIATAPSASSTEPEDVIEAPVASSSRRSAEGSDTETGPEAPRFTSTIKFPRS